MAIENNKKNKNGKKIMRKTVNTKKYNKKDR